MKKIAFFLLIMIAQLSCSSETKSETVESDTNSDKPTELVLKNACDIISVNDIAKLFTTEVAGIETYAKTPSPTKSTCQFTWQKSDAPTSGSQVMITISLNDQKAEMPRRFSNMLRMDMQNGVMGSKQHKIMPTSIEGFGENAYHWSELDFQNLQKIKFQVDENYYVEVFHNGNTAGDAEATKAKLLEISKTLKSQLN